jgi:hypothetical protein
MKPIINRDFDDTTHGFKNQVTKTAIGIPATPSSRLIALLLDGLIFAFGFGIVWFIWFITLAEKGTTPGHYLMGQTIVDSRTGESFGWKKMAIRELFLKGLLQWVLGSFLFMINYIIDGAFLLMNSRQTLHDLAIGSQVIQSNEKTIMHKLKFQ